MSKKKRKKKGPDFGVTITIHNEAATADSWVPVIEISEGNWHGQEREVDVHWVNIQDNNDEERCEYVGHLDKTKYPQPGLCYIEYKHPNKVLVPLQFKIPKFGELPDGVVITILIVSTMDDSSMSGVASKTLVIRRAKK